MNDAMMEPSSGLTGVERAAVLVMSLENDSAVQVLRQLKPREVQRLSRAMSGVGQISRGQLTAALRQFFVDVENATGLGIDSASDVRRLLAESLGEERAEVLFERNEGGEDSRGLETLKWLDARSIADFISREHPQIQAVVVAYLDESHAAEVLSFLSPNERVDIVMRMAMLEAVHPAALEELNALVEQRFASTAGMPGRPVAGRQVVADLLRHMKSTDLDPLLSALRREDQELGEDIEELMFVFEDLATLDAEDLRLFLAQISGKTLATALAAAAPEVRAALLERLPRRRAARIRRLLADGRSRQLGEAGAAQQEMIAIARRLAAAGELLIDLGRGEAGRETD